MESNTTCRNNFDRTNQMCPFFFYFFLASTKQIVFCRCSKRQLNLVSQSKKQTIRIIKLIKSIVNQKSDRCFRIHCIVVMNDVPGGIFSLYNNLILDVRSPLQTTSKKNKRKVHLYFFFLSFLGSSCTF